MLKRLRPSDEGGFTIVELMAALSVLAIGFFSLAGALGIGFREVALGRQRQTATEIGNGRIEHLRNVPYEAVGLSSQPTYDADPDKPDHFVSGDNTQYDVSGDGDFEDLIVDDAGGQVLHLEDPVTVGKTVMEVWQYVTWFDQPNNVKRLTVVIVYKPVAASGRARMVRVSTFFTPGTVTVEGAAPGANIGSPGATPTPTPTAGVCSGDTTAPTGSFSIVSTTGGIIGYTSSTSVTVSLSLSDSCAPIVVTLSNDGTTYSGESTYDANNPSVSWTLTPGDGTKSIYVKARDNALNTHTFDPATVVLDTVKPTVPGTLTRSVSCSGNNRTVTLNWGSSTDAHFSGYRLYESDNSGAWTVLTTSSLLTHTTTHLKTLDSVRFKVVGYDKAGNESDASNIVSLSKNQCS